ncbi:MAG: Gfo/Idh/MocA family oxidoreductase [Fimbriimonadaceae bacterium]|nr:Gfo/Idh/MocA family oxidoreductase [Fimbriimonadaceae bacterium]
MGEKLKVGVAGVGQIAKVLHIHEYAESPDCQLVAMYNENLSFCQDVIAEYEPQGVKFYDDLDAFLASGVQAISVCERNIKHAPVSLAALNAGVHVLCEKPMALTLADAQAMIDAAKAKDLVLMIDQSQRYSPMHRKAREILQSGLLGRIYHIQTTFAHPGPEGWSKTAAWFFNKSISGFGPLADLGVHKCDLVRYLTGLEAKQIIASKATLEKDGTVEDNSQALVVFDNGALGTISTSWTCHGTEDNSFSAFCEKGVLRLNVEPGAPIVVYDKDLKGRTEYPVGGMQANTQDKWWLGVIQDFVDAILGRQPNPVPGEEGYKALEMVVAMEQSIESGTWVHLPVAP